MGYSKFVEIGRICFVNYGADEGKICTIIDVLDSSRVLIDGPVDITGVHRQQISIRKLNLTGIKIKIPRSTSSTNIRKVMIKEDVINKWQNTQTAKKIQMQKERLNLTDFGRFKKMIFKKQKRNILEKHIRIARKK